MNKRMIFRILGLVLEVEAALMLLPLIVAVIYHESVIPFAVSTVVTGVLGYVMAAGRPDSTTFYAREGFVMVSLAWILMSLCGALPFVINGDIPDYVDAVFETVSGFTTTGATVIGNIEGCTKSGLFWRSFTHWIGGMGVLVFLMAVLPMSGEYSMHIMRAEIPGPVVGKLVPKARKTATILYVIYAALTVLETGFLMAGGMNFYEALLHAFGTAGTGGFSPRNASIGAYNSVYIEMVTAVFLVLFGINFNLYFLIAVGKIKSALKSEELYVYLGIILASTLIIAFTIAPSAGGIGNGLRHGFFNVISILSTAGFGTVDYTLWPQCLQVLIVLLMFCGACAGSTGGGLKISRLLILIKDTGAKITRMISTRRVKHVTVDGKTVPDNVVGTVCSFFFAYILIIMLCTFVVSFDGFDFTTSFTASLSCISNVGPGLSLVGPSGNYAIFSAVSKIAMIITMLLGRLEIYPVLILAASVLRGKRG